MPLSVFLNDGGLVHNSFLKALSVKCHPKQQKILQRQREKPLPLNGKCLQEGVATSILRFMIGSLWHGREKCKDWSAGVRK